jgi:NADPH:quinone reductase-like Zn-dependent oxidoreductase
MTDFRPEATAGSTSSIPATMRAIVQDRYGPPEQVLREQTVPVPHPAAGEVLVRVAACAVNALDWHYTTGLPMFARLSLGLRRPHRRTPGNDIAGTVVEVGPGVTQWRAGDQVFGSLDEGGGFAEYVVAPQQWLLARPETLGAEDAAAVGVAALTALQALRDWGGIEAGQSVLVNGASGGVGTYAVQLAKALGASHVTAVCSPGNVETARSLGADEVVDYTEQDVASLDLRVDLFLDNAGSTTIREAKRLLTKRGTYVMVTARKSRWLHPLPRMLATPLAYLGSPKRGVSGRVARRSIPDQELLRTWLLQGRVRPVMEARLPLSQGPEVVRIQGEFHARGKTVVVP